MKIGIPVGGFHQGNTSEYVMSALQAMGHEVKLLDQSTFLDAASQGGYDLFFCVDSGETLNLSALTAIPGALKKTAFWFIDYRHNKDRETRIPNDYQNARVLSENGGWVFQAQYQDVDDCLDTGVTRCSWLPMAADPNVWSDTPIERKQFDVVFIGNIWDEGRLDAVKRIEQSGLKAALLCNGRAWKEAAARAIRLSRIGFNISSWYGTRHAFDLNMRFFETLSCGVPTITNTVPALSRIFPVIPPFVREYSAPEQIVPMLREALADRDFLASGSAARNWVLVHGTYQHRMISALDTLTRELSR